MTRQNTDERVRDMVPLIEEELSVLLEQMPHATIKRMDPETKRNIIQRVLRKVVHAFMWQEALYLAIPALKWHNHQAYPTHTSSTVLVYYVVKWEWWEYPFNT